MKKLTIFVVILLIAGGAGYKFLKSKNKNGKVIYTADIVRTADLIEAVETTGEVNPLNRVEVKPSVGGRIDALLVDEGSEVKKGQVLAYLSSNDRVAILDAARARGENELKYWEDTYKPTPVLSPLNGTIILRNVVTGQTIDTATIIFAIADNLIVNANVDEADIRKIEVGQLADITLDAYPDTTVRGEIFQILYEGKKDKYSSNVITYPAKIKPFKIPSYFRSQMTANIRIIVNRKERALVVPSSFVAVSTGGIMSVLTGQADRPQPVEVKTGIVDGSNVEILSGLSEGATIYTAQQNYVPQKETGVNPFMPGGKPDDSKGKSGTQKVTGRARRIVPQ